ncbi:hypothetical protein BMS3Abin06_01457 [bacterium BMS3Abin06]|nr:hypothetical protein BMS3Abin06_01457 [bacterium BMS3Abin06]
MKVKKLLMEIKKMCKVCNECDPCCTGNILKKCIENKSITSFTGDEIALGTGADCKI